MTTTEDPTPIQNTKIIQIKKGTLFPFRFFKTIKVMSPDIIHFEYILGLYGTSNRHFWKYLKSLFFLFSVLIIGKFFKKKIILALHKVMVEYRDLFNFDNLILGKLVSLALKGINSVILLFSDKIIVFTDDGRNKLSNSIANKNKVEFIPLPSTEEIFSKIQHSEFTFIYFGFLKPNKGVMELLNAFWKLSTQVKSVKLIVAGGIDSSDDTIKNRSYLDSVIAKIKEMEDHSSNIEKYIDVISETKLKELLSVSDVIVMPYIDRYLEGSAVASKLLFTGIPFICSDVPRFELFIKNRCALPVNPNSIDDLCEKMAGIIRDKELYMNLSNSCLRLSHEHSNENISERYFKLYKSLFNSKGI